MTTQPHDSEPAPVSIGAENDLAPLLWAGIPVAIMTLALATPLLGFDTWKLLMVGEISVPEIGTVLVLALAIVLAIQVFRRRHDLPRGVGTATLFLGAGALFFLGEEMNWGQIYLFHRHDPTISEIPTEIALHKHWDVFDNLPRQITVYACLIGGVIAPWFRKDLQPTQARYWLIPTPRLVPIALLSVTCTLPEKILANQVDEVSREYLSLAFFRVSGEVKELCLAFVLLLGFLSILTRLRSRTH